jgi:ADP-heptose:LPS heptosyltransferase
MRLPWVTPDSDSAPRRYGEGFFYSPAKIWLARVLEWLTAPLAWGIPDSLPDGQIRKILILEPFVLGDAALLAVMLAPLKARFPEADIHLMVQPSSVDLFKHDSRVAYAHGFSFPWAQRAHKYRLWEWKWGELFRFIWAMNRERFDIGIDSRGEVRSQILMCLFGCRRRVGFSNYLCSNTHIRGLLLTDSLGDVPLQHRTRINMALCTFGTANGLWEKPAERTKTPGSQQQSVGLFPQLPALEWKTTPARRPDQFKIVFHTSGGWRYKMWKDDQWAELISLTAKTFDAAIVVVGASADKERLDAIRRGVPNTAQFAITTMDNLVDTLQSSDLVVCLDSGPMNIATMLGKPVLALFGPGMVEMYAPISPESRIVHHQGAFACAPCSQAVCISPADNCMKAISAEEVFRTLKQMVPPMYQ